MNSANKRVLCAIFGALALSFGFTAAAAGAPGIITTTDGRRLEGTIRWMGASKRYEIARRQSDVVLQLRPEQVRDIQVRKPEGLDAAIEDVRANKPDAAIPTLKRLVDTYAMLQWDIPATRWLAEAYLKKGNASEALNVCGAIVRDRPETGYNSELAPTYWRALLENERFSTLEKMLDRAMESPNNEMVARGLLMRGDLYKSRGELKNALKDGYLRVALLMKSVAEVQPEALYKAIRCFEELGQINYAEKMRTELLEKYGNSEQARRIARGG